jgi:hypothetical protein
MKKINPKVTKMAVLLLTLLLAGGTAIAVKEGVGAPDYGPQTEGETGV